MTRLSIIIFSIFCFSTSFAAPNESYKLSAGDVISIQVFNEPDLSFDRIKLTQEGGFNYPLLGEIKAINQTSYQLQNKLLSLLKDGYLINPEVSVTVIEFRQFFISGEVKKPDGYAFQPGLTVRRAVTLAGGLTERASKNKIYIIRETDESKTPRKASMDDIVLPGDSITIDQGFF